MERNTTDSQGKTAYDSSTEYKNKLKVVATCMCVVNKTQYTQKYWLYNIYYTDRHEPDMLKMLLSMVHSLHKPIKASHLCHSRSLLVIVIIRSPSVNAFERNRLGSKMNYTALLLIIVLQLIETTGRLKIILVTI